MKLIDAVLNDVKAFFKSNNEFFFNERDFQMHLAIFLKNSEAKYDDVDVEYTIPSDVFKEYPWNESDLRIDVVVREGNEYCPIELKYKTKSFKHSRLIDRFGAEIDCKKLVKNQGARDLGMYGFWKDVYRVEQLKQRFPNEVRNGLAILLTNDDGYKCKKLSENVIYKNFSMAEGEHDVSKHWSSNDSKVAQNKSFPNFTLNNKYSLEWQDVRCDGEDCCYTFAII